MCRSIKTLYNVEPEPTLSELEAAARQYVRKLSGYREPSRANQTAFEDAISQITTASQNLIDSLTTTAPKRAREASQR